MRTSWLLILLGFIKSSSQSYAYAPNPAYSTCDLSKEFDCGTGRLGCLPKAWQCDNIKDCHNGADERNCEEMCPEGELLCQEGKCVKSKSKCDGTPDCYDGSDEKFCEYNSRRIGVPVFGDPSVYIHGFDENGCLPGFGYCSTQQTCIPNRSFCDGKTDCFRGYEDELYCPRFYSHFDNPCEGKFVCRTNETYKDEICIQMSELCNGKKECSLGDDESDKCSECSTKHCEHQCQNTPTGAKCECDKGYRLDSDGITCVDLNECTFPQRVCHHFCENRIGSYRCSCAKGYHLDADGKSCELTNPSKGGSLLSIFHNEIEERPLDDFSRFNFTSVHKFNGTISTFDYFHRDHKLFMMTCNENFICHDGKLVMKEDGKPTKILRENIILSMSLAVDWIGRNIFFSEIVPEANYEYPPKSRISVCTMNGKFCRGIIEKREPSMYSNFVIHPIRGLVFYTEMKNNATRIMMAAMDGSQKQVLLETNSTISITMAIDYLNHDLYIADPAHANIRRVNIDTKKTTITAAKGSFSMMDSMVYHNGFLYSTVGTHIQVLDVTRENSRAHLFSHAVVNERLRLPPRMAINDSSHQLEPSHNPCQELDCPWICVMVPGFTAKCLCPDGYTSSFLGSTCIPASLETEKNLTLSFKSSIGLDLMSEYCTAGVGCLNGGSCREVLNRTRIACDCLEPFDGLYCERRKPMISDEAVAILVIILILLSIAIGCGVFFDRRNKKNGVADTISIVSKSTTGGAVSYANDAVSLG